jgi:hypothetical protein
MEDLREELQIQKFLSQKKKKNLEWIESNISKFITLKTIPHALLNDICFNYPLLYTFIRYLKYSKILSIQGDRSYEILTRTFNKEHLIPVLVYYDANLSSIHLDRLNKSEIFSILCELIRKKCQLDNFFIQDLFNPNTIFKDRYKSDSFTELFSTAFYYILNCEFDSTNFPLRRNNNANVTFKFPLDIDPIEFERPTIVIDVANQFNKNKDPSFSDYSNRVRYLKNNIVIILSKLLRKHDEQNLLVIFVHQGDRSKKLNCPELINILEWDQRGELDLLLNGTKDDPIDRKVFNISVPCHLFLSPELAYPSHTRIVNRNFYFNTGNDEPGYPRGGGYAERVQVRRTDPPISYLQQVKNTVYDRYGRMLFLPENGNIDTGMRSQNHSFRSYYGHPENNRAHIPYYNYEILDEKIYDPKRPPFRTQMKAIPHSIRHSKETKVFQGKNQFEKFVKPINECSGHTIFKNEIDDYMIGLLLYTHFKVFRECSNFSPYKSKWLLFTHDNYRWMNPEILDTKFIYRKDDFLSYIDHPITSIKNRLSVVNPSSKTIIQELGLYRFRHNYIKFQEVIKSIIRINSLP